jgi:hypothetical protein
VVSVVSLGWSPLLTVSSLLLSISSLLGDPNCGDPLNLDAADYYEQNKEEFDKVAREWTRKYAMSGKFQKKSLFEKSQEDPFAHLQQQPGQTDFWETVDEDDAINLAVKHSQPKHCASPAAGSSKMVNKKYQWSHELS